MNKSHSNSQLIERFYLAFAKKDFKTMVACYHQEIKFSDPAFGELKGAEVAKMWEMLLTRSKDLNIEFSDVDASDISGSANWVATYTFSKTGNKVINRIQARFEFKDNLIIKHTDIFDLHTWFVSAFGWKGFLFSAIPFLKNKFKQQVKRTLNHFITNTK